MNEALKNFLRGDTRPYGTRCGRCWRWRLDTDDVTPFGVLCSRCYLALEALFLENRLGDFLQANALSMDQAAEAFPYLRCVRP